MSKIELKIDFDKPDRIFRSGEEITGTLRVSVTNNIRCNGLILEHFWQTHGRGNTDRGDVQTTILAQGDWQAGQRMEYRFSFTAPNGPPTYHGHYLNIDHYINARVDIPWAFDPQCKEEYILQSTGGSYANLPTSIAQPGSGNGCFAKSGLPIAVILVLAGFFMFPFGLLVLPIAALFLFMAYRNVIAERKIGAVDLSIGPATSPGGVVPLNLRFSPRQSCSLNRITTRILAKESCTSGSGTKRTTYTHNLHERTFELVGSQQLVAGNPIRLNYKIPIPDTGAHSFEASDNKLQWELETRIDIPLWPDWTDKRGLLVRPGEAVEIVGAEVIEPPVIAEIKSSDSGSVPLATAMAAGAAAGRSSPAMTSSWTEPKSELKPDEEFEVIDLAAADADSDSKSPETAEEEVTEDGLAHLLHELASIRGYGNEHQQLIDRIADQTFPCTVRVDRIDRTFGLIDDERFRGGRTIVGKLEGLDVPATIRLDKARNSEIDGLRPGDRFDVQCAVSKWDTLYRRVELNERASSADG